MVDVNRTRRIAFEQAISRYPLRLSGRLDSCAERYPFPGMVALYKQMANGRPPLQADFISEVTRKMDPLFVSRHLDGVEARVSRTYCAMVQQHHMLLVLAEKFGNATWDAEMDCRHGIDLVSTVEGKQFGFTVSLESDRAHAQMTRKSDHYDRPPFPVLDVKIQPREYTCGRFWLYSPDSGEVEAFIEAHNGGPRA